MDAWQYINSESMTGYKLSNTEYVSYEGDNNKNFNQWESLYSYYYTNQNSQPYIFELLINNNNNTVLSEESKIIELLNYLKDLPIFEVHTLSQWIKALSKQNLICEDSAMNLLDKI